MVKFYLPKAFENLKTRVGISLTIANKTQKLLTLKFQSILNLEIKILNNDGQ